MPSLLASAPIPAPAPAPLFAHLTAFFSPLLPPSTRALWCFHGGHIATYGNHIDLFFGVWGSNDELVYRLRTLGLEVHDRNWLFDSVSEREKLALELYSFSQLEAQACEAASLLQPQVPSTSAARSKPCPLTATKPTGPAPFDGPGKAASCPRDDEHPSSAFAFSSDSDTSLKMQKRLLSPHKRHAQQILPFKPRFGSPIAAFAEPSNTHEAISDAGQPQEPQLPSFSLQRASAELGVAASPADWPKSTCSAGGAQASVPFISSLHHLDSFRAATASALPLGLNANLQPPPVSQAPSRSLGIDLQHETPSMQESAANNDTVLETSKQVNVRPELGEWTRSRNHEGEAETEAKLDLEGRASAKQLTAHLHLSTFAPPSAQAHPFSLPNSSAEHTSRLHSRLTATRPAASPSAYSPFFAAHLPPSSALSSASPPSRVPEIPVSEFFAALPMTLGHDCVDTSGSLRMGLRVMKHGEGGFSLRKIAGARNSSTSEGPHVR